MKNILVLFLSFVFITTYSQNIKVDNKYANTAKKMDSEKILQTIAFGSCNNQNKSQEIWKDVVKNRPELWIWLGDNIYADTKNTKLMAEKYTKQKNDINYRRLLACAMVIGTWDDHDFGANDAGKEFTNKKQSKRLLLDFLDVPKNAPSRHRKGAYQAYTFGKPGKKVKVILLDARYFRDELIKINLKHQKYKVNEEGDILGEEQWKWLEKELTKSDAQINLIASGIQMIPEEHAFEKWANYPKARKRLFHLLQKTKPAMPILMSGDRHIAELSKADVGGLETPVYEITASGLTHSWNQKREEINSYRVGEMVIAKNFGVMKIDWSGVTPRVTVEVRGLGNQLFLSHELRE